MDHDDDLGAQARAEGEATTADLHQRDVAGWEMSMRVGAANAEQAEANARLIDAQAKVALAQAKVRLSLAHLLDWLIVAVIIGALAWSVGTIW